jgi:hypothetical protein
MQKCMSTSIMIWPTYSFSCESFFHSSMVELLPLVSYALISPMVPASLTWVLNWHIALIGKGQVQMHTGVEGGGYRQVVLKPVDPCILNLSSSDCLLHLTITLCIKPFTLLMEERWSLQGLKCHNID